MINKLFPIYKFWYFGIFIFLLISPADAQDTKIISLFTPAPWDASISEDVSDVSGDHEKVVVNFTPLKDKGKKYRRVRLDFLGHSIIARRTRHRPGFQGSTAWIGKPEGMVGTVVLSAYGNVLFGRIEMESGIYTIEPVNGTGIHRVFKLNSDEAAHIDDGGVIPFEDKAPEDSPHIFESSQAADDGSVFDVLVLYTDGFAEAYAGDALTAQINYLISVANASYANSKINLTARVVGTKEVSYKDKGDLNTALDDLTDGNGVFSGVAALRDQLGADLVTLLRVFSSDNSSCGLAWQMMSLSNYFEKYAFSVVQVGRVSYGSGYQYCTDQSLAHEMGHNMGCNHDAAYATHGLFSYSRGYCFYPYKTVMSYCSSNETQVSYFSNPNVSYSGLATGTSDANNARSINKSKLTVSRFRDSKSLCLGSITAVPDKLEINKHGSGEITVAVADETGNPSENAAIKAGIAANGKKLITVTPASTTSNSSGIASFTVIAGKKKGKTRITFKSGCLKKSITVKVQ